MSPLAQLALQPRERLGAGAGKDHLRALRVQRAGDGAAKAARGAGHQRGPAVQVEHGRLPKGLRRRLPGPPAH